MKKVKKNYWLPGVDVILIDAEDVFTIVSLSDGNTSNISRSAGSDMLTANEYREIDEAETTDILSRHGVEF